MDEVFNFKREKSSMIKFLKVGAIALSVIVSASGVALAQTATMSAQQDAVDPAKLAAATKLLDTIMPPESRDTMMASMINPMMDNIKSSLTQNPELQKSMGSDPEMMKIFERFIESRKSSTIIKLQRELPSMMIAMARAYSRQFSLKEMADAEAFFSTPSGRAYMTKAGGIMADPDVAKWQSDMMSTAFTDDDGSLAKFKAEITAHLSAKNKKRKSRARK